MEGSNAKRGQIYTHSGVGSRRNSPEDEDVSFEEQDNHPYRSDDEQHLSEAVCEMEICEAESSANDAKDVCDSVSCAHEDQSMMNHDMDEREMDMMSIDSEVQTSEEGEETGVWGELESLFTTETSSSTAEREGKSCLPKNEPVLTDVSCSIHQPDGLPSNGYHRPFRWTGCRLDACV